MIQYVFSWLKDGLRVTEKLDRRREELQRSFHARVSPYKKVIYLYYHRDYTRQNMKLTTRDPQKPEYVLPTSYIGSHLVTAKNTHFFLRHRLARRYLNPTCRCVSLNYQLGKWQRQNFGDFTQHYNQQFSFRYDSNPPPPSAHTRIRTRHILIFSLVSRDSERQAKAPQSSCQPQSSCGPDASDFD